MLVSLISCTLFLQHPLVKKLLLLSFLYSDVHRRIWDPCRMCVCVFIHSQKLSHVYRDYALPSSLDWPEEEFSLFELGFVEHWSPLLPPWALASVSSGVLGPTV